MISTRWLERRTTHWTRLESLLDQAVRDGIRALTRSELRELSLLYRQTAADLSALREDPGGEGYARYLNQLLARAHNTIYAGRKSSAYDVLRFYRKDWPRVFRQTLPFTLTATALFLVGAVFGSVLTAVRPEFMHRLLGPQMVHTIESRKMWTDSVVSVKPLASSAIMTNNLSVSFMTFAAGITAGLGTLYMLIFNGVLLGVIGTACWISGMSLSLWSFRCAAWRTRITCHFYRRRRRADARKRSAVPRRVLAPRFAGDFGSAGRAFGVGDYSPVDRRRNNRRISLAIQAAAEREADLRCGDGCAVRGVAAVVAG